MSTDPTPAADSAGGAESAAGPRSEELDRLVARLEDAAGRLRSGDLEPDAAATLVEGCAQMASQASAELERLAREAAQDAPRGQDSLL